MLILTVLGGPGNLRRAVAAHVAGFLVKDTPVGELVEAVRNRPGAEDTTMSLTATRRRLVTAGSHLHDPGQVLTRLLAADRWKTSDPVWWRPGRSPGYVLLDAEQAAALEAGL